MHSEHDQGFQLSTGVRATTQHAMCAMQSRSLYLDWTQARARQEDAAAYAVSQMLHIHPRPWTRHAMRHASTLFINIQQHRCSLQALALFKPAIRATELLPQLPASNRRCSHSHEMCTSQGLVPTYVPLTRPIHQAALCHCTGQRSASTPRTGFPTIDTLPRNPGSE